MPTFPEDDDDRPDFTALLRGWLALSTSNKKVTMATKDILSADEVATRWGVKVEHVWDAVDDADHPLPFIKFGVTAARRRQKGRELYRFRLVSIIRWEEDQERAFPKRVTSSEAQLIAGLAAYGHDGVIRCRRKGKAGPRNPT